MSPALEGECLPTGPPREVLGLGLEFPTAKALNGKVRA